MKHQSRIERAFFIYSVTFALNAAASDTQVFNIEADSDFRLEMLTQFTNIAQAIQTDSSRVIPICTAQITNTGSGRNFMDVAQPLNNIFGTGKDPFVLPTPKIFTARATVSVLTTNLTAGTNYNLTLSFIGTKLYKL